MSNYIYPIPESTSGADAIEKSQTELSILEPMILEDMSIIAGTYKNADGSPISMLQKFSAFQELSGYMNGTDSRFAALTSDFDTAQKALLKTDTLNCLKNFNDVEIPVGKDKDGNPVFERVYTDAAHTVPATAADMVNNWENTGANGTTKFNFYFSYTSNDIDVGNSGNESWAGQSAESLTPNSCRDDGHDTCNPTGEAGGGVTVDEHREYSGQIDMSCSGDAQALAGYCNYGHLDPGATTDSTYDYSGDFNDFLKQNNWSGA
jgi:hypothetical protein